MQFISPLPLLALLLVLAASTPTSSALPGKTRNLADTPDAVVEADGNSPNCFDSWKIKTNETCSYESLLSLLQDRMDSKRRCDGRSAKDELAYILDIDTTDQAISTTTLEQVVAALCDVAIATEIENDSLSFLTITKESEVFNKAYFDGDTYYNDARETSLTFGGDVEDVLSNKPGARIASMYTRAEKKVITFPGDEEERPMANFDQCEYNAAMCCWVQDRQANDNNNGNCAEDYDDNCVNADPGDNTDLCYVDMSRAPTSARVEQGYAVYPGDTEGATHCHGFAWADDKRDESAMFKGNNLFFISMYDHLYKRGYVGNVPGAPMCGCLEQMPVVSRSDCTQIDSTLKTKFSYQDGQLSVSIVNIDVEFNACEGVDGTNNDLRAHYEKLVIEGKIADEDKFLGVKEVLVENCEDPIKNFVTNVILASL